MIFSRADLITRPPYSSKALLVYLIFWYFTNLNNTNLDLNKIEYSGFRVDRRCVDRHSRPGFGLEAEWAAGAQAKKSCIKFK